MYGLPEVNSSKKGVYRIKIADIYPIINAFLVLFNFKNFFYTVSITQGCDKVGQFYKNEPVGESLSGLRTFVRKLVMTLKRKKMDYQSIVIV